MLSWGNGDTGTKSITFYPLNASSGNKTVELELVSLTSAGAEPKSATLGLAAMTVTIVDVSGDRDLTIAFADNAVLSGAQELAGDPALSGEVWLYLAEVPLQVCENYAENPTNVSATEWYYGDGTLPAQVTLDALTSASDEFVVDDPYFQGLVDSLPQAWDTTAGPPAVGGVVTETQLGAYAEPADYRWGERASVSDFGLSPSASPNNWFAYPSAEPAGGIAHYPEALKALRYLRGQADIVLNGGSAAAQAATTL